MLRRALFVVVVSASLWGCGSHGTSSVVSPSGLTTPSIVQPGGSAWSTFDLGSGVGILRAIATGHDGRMWIAAPDINSLITLDMDGHATTYPFTGGTLSKNAEAITPNPDGFLYAIESTNGGDAIAQVGVDGSVANSFALPAGISPAAIVSGSDGNLWLTHTSPDGVGRLTTQGVYTDFPLPQDAGLARDAIIRGPDKNLWALGQIVNTGMPELLRISVTDGHVTEYMLPSRSTSAFGLVDGNDGGVWALVAFSGDLDAVIVRFDPQTQTSLFYALKTKQEPTYPVLGPNHRIYWAQSSGVKGFNIESHRTLANAKVPGLAYASNLLRGPDGQIWTDGYHFVNVLLTREIVTVPSAVVVGVGGQTPLSVSEPRQNNAKFTAISNDPSIATVTGGPTSFTVTGVAQGSTTITVSDSVGNSLDVPVTVN